MIRLGGYGVDQGLERERNREEREGGRGRETEKLMILVKFSKSRC
jgi:hypothetical protein